MKIQNIGLYELDESRVKLKDFTIDEYLELVLSKKLLENIRWTKEHSELVIKRMRTENPKGNTKYLEHGVDLMNKLIEVSST